MQSRLRWHREAKCLHLISSKHSKALTLGWRGTFGFSPKISMKNCREPERMAFNNVLSSSTVEILDDLLVAQFWGTSIYNYPPWTSMRWCDYSGSPKIIEKSNACGKGFPMQKKSKAGVVFKSCREMLFKLGIPKTWDPICPKFPRNQWNPPISSASSTFGRIGQCMSM